MDIYAIARAIKGKAIKDIIDVNQQTNEFTIVFDDNSCLEVKELSKDAIIDLNFIQ